MTCRLCLTENDDLLEIFTDEGRTLNIADIISKHFWFEVIFTEFVGLPSA
jgi:hypothetical protein